jgi:hypothetical protein
VNKFVPGQRVVTPGGEGEVVKAGFRRSGVYLGTEDHRRVEAWFDNADLKTLVERDLEDLV